MAQPPLIPFDYLEREKRRAAQQPPPADPVARTLQRIEDERARADLMRAPPPDEAAKVTRVAREAGEPPAMVEGRTAEVERSRNLDFMFSMFDSYPLFRKWFGEEPRAAAAAVDDHKALGMLGSAMGAAKQAGLATSTFFPTGTYAPGERQAVLDANRERFRYTAPIRSKSYWGRTTAIAGQTALSIAAGAARSTIALGDAGRKYLGDGPGDDFVRGLLTDFARLGEGISGQRVEGATTYAEVKANPFLAPKFIAEQAPGSLVITPLLLNPYGAGAYTYGNAGTIAQRRAVNDGREQAGAGDLAIAAPVAAASTALERLGFERLLRPGTGGLATRVAKSAVTEGLTEGAQGAIENIGASVGTERGFDAQEFQDEVAAGALVGFGAGAGFRGGVEALQSAVRVAGQVEDARQAKQAAAVMDGIERAASESKLRQRDPEAYAALVGRTAEDAGVTHAYVPAEAIRAYQQSDSYDQFDDPFADFQDQIAEAEAVGGDVILPASFAFGSLPGTAAWAAVKDDIRFAPGGMSSREADAFQAELDDVMAELSDQAAQRDREQQGERTAREQIVQRVSAMLQNAGFTPANAAVQAELIAQREAVRAQRMGRDLTGQEFGTEVRQVLPPALADIVRADGLDLVFNAMRKAADPKVKRGQSLLEFISARGGIEDRGGDIAAMGGATWHKGKVGKRKLLKDYNDKQGNILGGSGNRDNSIDALFQEAISAGYFPDLMGTQALNIEGGIDTSTYADKVDTAVFLDAIGRELRGDLIYAEEATQDNVRMAAAELEALLGQRGLDPASMTDAELRDAVDALSQEQDGGRAFGQADLPETIDIDGVQRPTRNSEGQQIARDEAGLRAFWAWFGDSKVVDDEGRPLVVYHGAPDARDINSPDGAFKSFDQRFGGDKQGVHWFTPSRATAATYADDRRAFDYQNAEPAVIPAYLRLSDPSTVNGLGKEWREAQAIGKTTDVIEAAQEAGNDGVIITNVKDDYNNSARTRTTTTYAVFSDTQIKSINNRGTFDPGDARILYQSLNEGPRGRIIFDNGPPVIELFQGRNLSTLLHELGHQWLEELRVDAETEGASDQIKADWQTVQDWFAANGHPVTDGVIPVEAHEMWARGHERYLMEGKSPSSALTRLFETFRGWLLNIYKTVDALRAPITPEIREVFDRLLATDEEITAQRDAQSLQPLFKDAAAIGMTGQEFEAYTAQAQAAKDSANAALLQKTMAAIRRRETKRFNDERKGVIAQEAERLDAEPILKSLALMKETPIDQDWLTDRMGQDVTDLLPKRVPPIYKPGGVNPDTLAEMAGFTSGQQMIEMLIGAERQHREAKATGDKRAMRNRMIETAADAEMARRYGDDPFNDGSIEQEAIAAVNGELQGELLASEVRLLSRRTGARPTPYKIARQWARNRVRTGQVSVEASPGAIARHARNVAKAGRDAEKAMLAGKMDEALRFKQQQMISSALLAEAKEAYDFVTKAVKRLSSVQRNRKRDTIDPDYWEQAQALLAGYEFIPRTEKLMRERENFERWAAARRAEGEEIQIPERLVASGTNYTRMTVEEIQGVDDAVKSILHLGRRKKELLLGKERRDWNEARGEWLNGAENLPERPEGPDRNAAPSKVRGIISNFIRIDMMAKIMDGGNPNGLMTRILANGAKESDNTFARLQKTVLEPIADAYLSMKGSRLFDRVSAPEWIDYRTGQPQVFLRSDLLAIAANLGNESNLRKMLAGEALLFKGQEELAPTLEGVTAMLNRELNEAEWQMVITAWRQVEKMGEEAFAAERELTGVKPEKIEPRMVQTPFGEVMGGYWPAVYDTDAVRAADAGVNLDEIKGDDFEALIGKHGVGTNKGYTISRTDFVAPMLLNFEAVLFGHVNQVAKRVAYQAWAKNALKVIRDRRIKAMWARKLGPEYHAQLEPWLRDVINQGQIANMGHVSAVDSLLRQARMNLTAMGLVFRATTLVAQMGGLPNSMKAIGAENVIKGFRLYAKDNGAAIARVMEASPLMARRLNEFDRDQAAALAEMRNPPTTEIGRKLKPAADARDRFNAAGFHLIGAIQLYTVDLPTWLGAYDKAMRTAEEGGLDLDHDAAVNYADRMVEEAQGAGRTAQLAAIQRMGETSRILTLFYTFFGTVMNYQWEMTQDLRAGQYKKAAISAGWIMVVAPIIGSLIADAIRGDLPDDDNDDTWLAWALRKVFFGMFSGVPILRDFANQAERKASGKYAPDPTTPWQRISSALGGAGGDAFAALSQTDSYRMLQRNTDFLPEPTEVSDNWLKHGIEALGFATGTGLGQVAATSQFALDVAEGDQRPQSVGDVVQGAAIGKIKDE